MEEVCRKEREKHAQEMSSLEENLNEGFTSVSSTSGRFNNISKLLYFIKFSLLEMLYFEQMKTNSNPENT